MTAIAFCDRESDLAKMTIHRLDDGRLVARRRRPDDSIVPIHRTGSFGDLWLHVGSGGRYIRHDEVFDEDLGIYCYDYSSCENGRLWLRSIAEWHEPRPDGRTRFERIH